MTRANKGKTSKYKVYVGYALQLYCDTFQEAERIVEIYGKDKVSIEKL